MEDKSLFFITLSVVCIWLVIDSIIGKKYVKSILHSLFPFISED